jgi:hypothetical protein
MDMQEREGDMMFREEQAWICIRERETGKET